MKEVIFMTPLQILCLIGLIATALISLCFVYQVIYLFVPLLVKGKKTKQPAKQHRYAILIAARNEEQVLPHLLHSIALQDYPKELIHTYVVADNCTDATAQVAAAGGATVFCRTDSKHIGKGRALAFLLDQIKNAGQYGQYDAFLVFDADNVLDASYITNINRTCADGYQAFCGYRNAKNFGANWISAGHAMWYLHDCVQLNLSRYLLGISCSVTGTGFGFTRQLLDKRGGWRFFTLTEDIEFSVWCALKGIRIGYCNDAVLYDEQPENLTFSFRQRVRWVQGTIQISFRYFKRLVQGLKKGGKYGYTCLEHLTLTIWGYLLCALFGIVNTVLTILAFGVLPALWGFLIFTAGAFVYTLISAALILITQRKRIRATTAQRWKALFAYPLYIVSFLPIFFMAVFSEYNWPPIEHKVAISAEELTSK